MNRLTLAVAGGRKTQSIVDACCGASASKRVLVLTYTQANQDELRNRLARFGPHACRVEVQGWFSFLLGHWVRPFLPCLFRDQRLRGLNFEGEPNQYAKGLSRFMDDEQRAYKRHLARLAHEVNEASGEAALDRLSRLFDVIYVDEVQDLNGWDLEILLRIMASSIDLELVGDIRQAILLTNVQDQKNSQYKGTDVIKWFRKQEKAGVLVIQHQNKTWRSTGEIAALADSIFGPEWGFPATESEAPVPTGHQGLFTVNPEVAETYARRFDPMCLRSQSNVGTSLDLPYTNIGLAKGMEADHVLLWPTGTMSNFLIQRTALAPKTACLLYVATTRARASVAVISAKPIPGFTEWTPRVDSCVRANRDGLWSLPAHKGPISGSLPMRT